MSRKLYDYMILPEQLTLLFTEYNMVTYSLIDSYVYNCDVYSDGNTSKREFICVKIKKHGEPTIYCNSMNFNEFLGKSILNQNNSIEISTRKKTV